MFKIKKAKLIEGKRPEYAFTRDNSKRQFEGTETGKDDAHPDLIAAFHALTPHWALLAGQIQYDDLTDIDAVDEKLLEPFTCYAFAIGGNEKKQGISLSGQYKLPNGKVMSWAAPFELFAAADDKRYIFMDDLVAKLELLDKELIQYIEGGKTAPNLQQEINFNADGEEVVTSAQIAQPETKFFSASDADSSVVDTEAEKQAETPDANKTRSKAGRPPGKAAKKRVPQSADHPGGIIE
jgi:hypothetical protein